MALGLWNEQFDMNNFHVIDHLQRELNNLHVIDTIVDNLCVMHSAREAVILVRLYQVVRTSHSSYQCQRQLMCLVDMKWFRCDIRCC